jgi:hypothetical protein
MQYGPNLRALACYLVVFQHVPAERAALLIADVTGAGGPGRVDRPHGGAHRAGEPATSYTA